MREYEMEVLEKYELEVNSTRRIRGAFYCDTKEGTMLLKETKISERRVPLLYLILNRLESRDIWWIHLCSVKKGIWFRIPEMEQDI